MDSSIQCCAPGSRTSTWSCDPTGHPCAVQLLRQRQCRSLAAPVARAGPQTLDTVDVGAVAQRMAALLRTHLADPDVADCLLPGRSATLPHDRPTAAMVLLGTMKEYFSYDVVFGCGFPSVTLHGTRDDWADLLQRAGRFSRFGDEPTAWSHCLVKVLGYMVASFDRPNDADVRDFWMRSCHSAGAETSGELVTMSGWLTAFLMVDGGQGQAENIPGR